MSKVILIVKIIPFLTMWNLLWSPRTFSILQKTEEYMSAASQQAQNPTFASLTMFCKYCSIHYRLRGIFLYEAKKREEHSNFYAWHNLCANWARIWPYELIGTISNTDERKIKCRTMKILTLSISLTLLTEMMGSNVDLLNNLISFPFVYN